MEWTPRVLIGCETSGVVRRAFDRRGFDAWSCDLLPSDDRSNRHIQDDIRNVLLDEWDLIIVAHPPCTRLCNSGVRWLHKPPRGKTRDQMWKELDEAADLFSTIWNADCPRVAIENPVMHKYAVERIENYHRQAQTVQPHHFGDPAFKATNLYLRNLPPLKRTHWMDVPDKKTEPERHKRWSFIHRATPGPERWKLRSKTFDGIADAMAEQWGDAIIFG